MREQLQFFLAYDVKYRASKWRENVLSWIAWHLPRELVMWCFVRVAAHATVGKYGDSHPDQVSIMDALKRWNDA